MSRLVAGVHIGVQFARELPYALTSANAARTLPKEWSPPEATP